MSKQMDSSCFCACCRDWRNDLTAMMSAFSDNVIGRINRKEFASKEHGAIALLMLELNGEITKLVRKERSHL